MTKDEQWLVEEKYFGEKTAKYEIDKNRLAKGEPLGYVIGWQPFLGLKIHLDSRPLIPRSETEWWTEKMLMAVATKTAKNLKRPSESKFRFLDLCAGSGAIGCAALAQLSNTKIFFGEIDPIHRETILKNIRENDLDESRIDIRIGDLFAPFGHMNFDFIATNPPYIPTGRTLPESITKWEPGSALRAGADGLALIRRIASQLSLHLRPGGEAWIECDSEHIKVARSLFEARGLLTEACADQYGAPRVIVVSFP